MNRDPHDDSRASGDRRHFIWSGLIALTAGLLGKKAFAGDEAPIEGPLTTEGQVLKSSVYKGRPPIEPLDTMIRFERSDETTGTVGTQEILSLMHEQKGNGTSYPWTIYTHLTTNHTGGDACVLCSRLTKNGVGWSSGLHSEVFAHGRGVALGVNVEMSNNYTGSEPTQIYGINVLAAHGNPCDIGIHIHDMNSHWKTAIQMDGKGEYGVDMRGKYDTGLNMHANNIRMDEGSCIELDGEGKIKVRYKAGRIEFLNGDKCIGHLDVNEKDHAL